MTDTTTPTEAPKPTVVLDDFGTMAKERLVGVINEYNSYAAQVKAATGDPQSLLETLRESSDNADAAKITQAIKDLDDKREALFTKRDEILKPVVAAMVEQAKAGSEGVAEKAAALKKTVDAGRKYLVDLYGDGAVDDLPKIVGTRAVHASTGAPTGRRIRGFDAWVDGVLATARNGKGEETSNLAAAAKKIGVDTEQMRELFWGAAGTKDPKDYPATVEFTVTVGENTHTITCKRVKEDEARATETAAPAAS